jgi:cytoplasmic iron level regulating protein YaaA (DUF328/UPF0246 family)
MKKASNTNLYTKPKFTKEASLLMKELLNYSPPEMESLMKINSELAEQNFMRHVLWRKEHNISNGKQALLAYDGAVYQGINTVDLNEEQLSFANIHFRILSGLYGVLRPLDIIQPYRLEMSTKLKNMQGNNLYSFWKDRLTNYFKEELESQNDNILIDLASKEYSSAIDLNKINVKVITPIFKDYKRGSHKVITIYTKRARGLISRFVIENRIVSPNELKEFNAEGYSYNEYMSGDKEWVFTR